MSVHASDVLEAVQALQEAGIPPICAAVAWVLAGGKPASAHLINNVRATIYVMVGKRQLRAVGRVPGRRGGQSPRYYHVVAR